MRRGITLGLVVGFFVTLVLAWYHGERGAQRVTGTELLIIGLVLALGRGFLWRLLRRVHRMAKTAIVPNESMTTRSETPTPTSRPQKSRVESQVPEAILGPILNEAAKLGGVPVQQLVIVRAEAVVWNDGSLGCPEPGMEYSQTLINGYWVLISRQRDRCMTFAWVAAAAFAYVRRAAADRRYHPTHDATACDITSRTR